VYGAKRLLAGRFIVRYALRAFSIRQRKAIWLGSAPSTRVHAVHRVHPRPTKGGHYKHEVATEPRLIAGANASGTEAEGRRTMKVTATETKQYVWDEQNVLHETDASLASIAQYTDPPGEWGRKFSLHRSGGSAFYVPDHQGNSRVLTDATGAVTDTLLTDAWGVEVAASGVTVNPYRAFGQWGYERDAASRLYVRARHLRVDLGRWVSRDPIRAGTSSSHMVRHALMHAAGLTPAEIQSAIVIARMSSLGQALRTATNRAVFVADPTSYAYVASSPLARCDPSGQIAQWIGGGGIGCLGGALTGGLIDFITGNTCVGLCKAAVGCVSGAIAGILVTIPGLQELSGAIVGCISGMAASGIGGFLGSTCGSICNGCGLSFGANWGCIAAGMALGCFSGGAVGSIPGESDPVKHAEFWLAQKILSVIYGAVGRTCSTAYTLEHGT
jgi:hypothetical protein